MLEIKQNTSRINSGGGEEKKGPLVYIRFIISRTKKSHWLHAALPAV
jgi:hypothetical protein